MTAPLLKSVIGVSRGNGLGAASQPPMNTSPDPAVADPPQPMASPTRPAGLPLMNTVPEPPERLRGCGGAGQTPQACGA